MRKKIFTVLSILWMAGVSYLLTHMHAWHQLGIKSELSQTSFTLPSVPAGAYGMVHFLGEGCGCSKIIAEYLAKRGKLSGVPEEIWLVGEMKEVAQTLRDKGLIVRSFKVEKDQAPPINAVPAFGVYDHQKKFHYMGAYTDGPVRPHSVFKDLETLKSIKHHRTVASLDVMGCAVSKQYQKLLDPFGIKYGVRE